MNYFHFPAYVDPSLISRKRCSYDVYMLFKGTNVKSAGFLKVTSEIPMGGMAAVVGSLPDSSPPPPHTLIYSLLTLH